MKKLIPGILLAFFFWFIMFSPWTAALFNFWGVMLAATATLTTYSLIIGKNDLKEVYNFKLSYIFIGILAAVCLYLLFFIGNYVSNLLFNFSKGQVENIYATKVQASKILIGLSLFLWIGPSEEIFWRGFVQHNFGKKYGNVNGFIITTLIYTLVHIWSFNFMLIMAALICGLFLGWMYLRFKSVIPGIISHAIWAAVIFVILTIT